MPAHQERCEQQPGGRCARLACRVCAGGQLQEEDEPAQQYSGVLFNLHKVPFGLHTQGRLNTRRGAARRPGAALCHGWDRASSTSVSL